MRAFTLLLLATGLSACDSSPKRLDPVPAALQPRVEVAKTAAADLKKTLSGRLLSTVQQKGPKAGIDVCADEARTMTQTVAQRHGVEIGRTSAKLRNPENAARPWVDAYLRSVADKKVADVKPAVYDLGKRIGVVEPLGTQALCLNCHGAESSLSGEVKEALAARYPKDTATGFAEGDVRGVLWVELPKEN
ncbi:MAG: DUF3365 domain-containing protein [Polyangiaceae bacterium]